MSKKENFFGKNYDVPSGMSPADFERKLDQWKEHEEIQRKGDRGSPLAKEFEQMNEAAMLLKTKDLIRGVTLKDGFVSEENQKKLEERKRIALEYLDKLIFRDSNGKISGGYVTEYASSVLQSEYRRDLLSGGKEDAEKFAEIDAERSRRHNALMSHMTATIRYIRNQFSSMSKDQLEDMEEQLEHNEKLRLIPISRVAFPGGENIFLPRYVDMKNRQSVTVWSEAIKEELSKISK